MRLEIHVRPNARTAGVGGSHDGALVVRVAEPAERGRATAAALGALAHSLGVPRRSVALVRGATSRRKLVDVSTSPAGAAELAERVERLLARPDR